LLSILVLPLSGACAGPLPESPGAALKNGWQLLSFAVAYGPVPIVSTSFGGSIETEVYRDIYDLYILRKGDNYIQCVNKEFKRAGSEWAFEKSWCAEIY
jgi:hypothetical protein